MIIEPVVTKDGTKIIPLSEGEFTIDSSKVMVPYNAETDNLADRPGSLLVEVTPFLVVNKKDVILLDAGLGYKIDGELQIHKTLRAYGYEPEDVTKVLVSHLHKDHAGGLMYTDKYNDPQPAFKNAVYFVHRQAFDYSMETGYPKYLTEEFEWLDSYSKVFWLTDDDGTIDNYIHYKITNGHSPFHQVFWIEELNGRPIFFGADDAPQYKQMIKKFSAKYDYDGKRSMELRQEWWDAGQENHWTFLFYHDTRSAVFQCE